MKKDKKAIIKQIEQTGACLVYPIQGKEKSIPSLWSFLYPRSKMRWDWSEGADQRVSEVWWLRDELARSKKVVYTKFYKGRGTFFSKEVFTALLCVKQKQTHAMFVQKASKQILESLLDNSPQTTRELKKSTGLQGKFFERDYQKACKELWEKTLIIGLGDSYEEGAMPSLLTGATELIFEDLWKKAQQMELATAQQILASKPTVFLFI